MTNVADTQHAYHLTKFDPKSIPLQWGVDGNDEWSWKCRGGNGIRGCGVRNRMPEHGSFDVCFGCGMLVRVRDTD